jgi:hypothetical protein
MSMPDWRTAITSSGCTAPEEGDCAVAGGPPSTALASKNMAASRRRFIGRFSWIFYIGLLIRQGILCGPLLNQASENNDNF